jgi:hypothetical protein
MDRAWSYYRCPNGPVILTGEGDDKAACSCGRGLIGDENPQCIGISVHRVAGLAKATEAEFLTYMDQQRAAAAVRRSLVSAKQPRRLAEPPRVVRRAPHRLAPKGGRRQV